ncbi:glutamate racemase [Tepidicaulis marinus]|jgi:glutamate racemase|uniref:Glutamate racemase n=1 Tax=Tepidicaulis marinus TaxID=1333998 RepID=A0A081BB87_9HYPH|nr:glutamate racemase [Tepidicaulis marinus]GAK45305.1 glutamate racemase [Tepidicaulis marinus]
MSDNRPIGVFDSGMGGLTVLKALRAALPGEDLVYLGDTARLPYGTKSPETVRAYALQAVQLLMSHDVKLVVIACNTASSVALGPLSDALRPLPVIGVVEPGAEAGCSATKNGHIAVIATESTVKGGAYERAIHALNADAQVTQLACPLFVALAEEGWTEGEVTEGAVKRYLLPLFPDGGEVPDTLVLGCTHFPVLAPAIGQVLGDKVTLVDSAATTARAVALTLKDKDIAHAPADEKSIVRFMATDSPERFARVGSVFFGEAIEPENVELVDLKPAPA